MIPRDYDELIDGIRDAQSIHVYLKFIGVLALQQAGFPQDLISQAASDALEPHARTRRKHASLIRDLSKLSNQDNPPTK